MGEGEVEERNMLLNKGKQEVLGTLEKCPVCPILAPEDLHGMVASLKRDRVKAVVQATRWRGKLPHRRIGGGNREGEK